MNQLKLIFTICFRILSFAVANASFAWSDKIIVTEHDLITNKVELASGLTFIISKDFLVEDDLITNLIGQYQEGNAKYFFANISLGSFTFASVKFDTLDAKIKQENLVDLADEQLEEYFGNEKKSFMEHYSSIKQQTFSDYSWELKEFSDKIYLVSSYTVETDNTEADYFNDGIVEEVISHYAYYDYPNGFSLSIRGVSDANETLKSHAERIIKSIIYP